jgi:predicted RNase H-like nuclease (RuvC/YqgF family)
MSDTLLTPRTDAQWIGAQDTYDYVERDFARQLEKELTEKTNEVARLREENAKLKQGKVFVDPKWIYDLETQLEKAREELCQAGLREYENHNRYTTNR